jgi:hypothetical protein
MAVADFEHVVELTAFAGLRNTVPPERFAVEDLEAALNVDIDDSRQLRRRKGMTLARAGTIRSVWANSAIALAVADDTTLARLSLAGSTAAAATLRTGLTPGQPMSFDYIGGRVYYANGAETGVVDNGVSRSWGLPAPGAPALAAIGGTLRAGRYQVAITNLRSDGQESGARPAAVIDLPATGGIRLSGITSAADSGIAARALYVSTCNGDTLYRAGILSPSDTTADYATEPPSMEVPLRTLHLQAPSAFKYVSTMLGGWTLGARGRQLFYSEPISPELFDLRKNYTFLSNITLLVGLHAGALVGTETGVYWLAGQDPQKWTLEDRMAYGAIDGASATFALKDIDGSSDGRGVAFATERGICLCTDDGKVVNLTQDRFAYPIQQHGAMTVRRHGGMIQALCVMRGQEKDGNAAFSGS